jgi:hypothetical protein
MSKLSCYFFSGGGFGSGDSASQHFPVTATEANAPYPAIALTMNFGSGAK